MADSVSQITKNPDKTKFSNSVNRITTETLRVNESDRSVNQPNSLNVSASNPKKKTSFQITSVTVGSRLSNDGGDDSADDLDESHTDDVSEVNDTSRATDLERETPSYSEDTFSKDDVFFNASTSLASAPVIPTSSQYGLAILDSNEACEVMNPADVGSNLPDSDLAVVTEKVINLVSAKHDSEVRDSPHTHTTRSERFKVVKIESTEPFKRGRWVCMDYLDHSISQPPPTNPSKVNEGTDSPNQPSAPEPLNTVVESNTIVNPVSTLGHDESHSVETVSNVINASVQHESSQISNNQMPVSSASSSTIYTSSPGQTLQSNIQMNPTVTTVPQVTQHGQSLSQVSVQHSVPNSNQHQSLQPQQIQQVLANANIIQLQQQQAPQTQQTIMQQPPIQQLQQIQQQQQQVQQQFQQQQFQALHQQQQQSQQLLQQQQQAAVLQQQLAVQQAHLQGLPHMGIQQPLQTMHQVPFNQQIQQQPGSQQQGMIQAMHQQTIQNFQPNMNIQQMIPPQVQQQYYQNIPQISNPVSSTVVPTPHIPMQNFPGTSLPQSIINPSQVPNNYTLPMSSHVPTPTNQPTSTIQTMPSMLPPQGFVTMASPPQTYCASVVSSVPSSTMLDTTTPNSDVAESLTPATVLLESLVAAAEDPVPGEDAESASGASAVAIDNKIEQAMDLVKSHLMFAVREEVEVLKEKISELMERINQLEVENTILRAHASQETLSQLPVPVSQAAHPPQTNNST